MKVIISEEQLRLIIESEKKGNLLNFTTISKTIPATEWDNKFLEINESNGFIYDGYYLNGDVKLNRSDVKELNYLVKVLGNLDLKLSEIESLDKLTHVTVTLLLRKSKIKSLGN
jgi:hypothetical protein